jgi:hypothetical protein
MEATDLSAAVLSLDLVPRSMSYTSFPSPFTLRLSGLHRYEFGLSEVLNFWCGVIKFTAKGDKLQLYNTTFGMAMNVVNKHRNGVTK